MAETVSSKTTGRLSSEDKSVGRLSGNKTESGRLSTNKLDLELNDNLRFLAEQEGFREKKTLNFVNKVGRILNKDIAAISGGIRGLIRDDETFGEGVQRGLKENIGFSDVIREVVGTPETRAGKIAVGTFGFAADVLFSPLTYLTFGTSAGLKASGQVLTKGATKLAQKGAKEIRQGVSSRADEFIKEGVHPSRAARLAKSEAERDINELFQKIASKEGLSEQGIPIYHGTPKQTFEQIQKEGLKIVDRPDTMNKGSGISFSKIKTHAEKFARGGGGVVKAFISKNAKLIEGDVFNSKMKEIYDGPTLHLREKSATQAADFFKKQGYDGVDFTKAKNKLASESVEGEIRIWNLNKLKTQPNFTVESIEKFIEKGLNVGTVEAIQRLGPTILDKGGIKWFGKTLITSERLGQTAVGKAAKALGNQEIVQAVKNTLGRAFVFNFAKNPQLAEAIKNISITSRRAIAGITKSVDDLFKGTTEKEQVEFFDKVFNERVATVEKAAEIEEQYIKELSNKFPELKIKNPEDGKRVLAGLEDSTQKTVEGIRKEIDEIAKPFFDSIKMSAEAGALPAGKAGLQKEPFRRGVSKVIELENVIKDMRKMISNLRKAKTGKGDLALKSGKELAVELTDDEVARTANALIVHEENRLNEIANSLAEKYRRLKEKPDVKGVKQVKLKEGSELEIIALAEKEILKLQNDLAEKSHLIGKMLNARRTAKQLMREKKVDFGSAKMNAIGKILFEGDNSIMAKTAKAAGITEADAFKYYLSSKFKNIHTVKGFATGHGLSAPATNFLKEFRGAQDETLVKNAAEALKRTRIDVANARIKSDAIKAMFNEGGLGKPLASMSESEAARLGYVKFERKLIDGKFEGWMPKQLKKDLDDFLEPKASSIDELGRNLGFDYATGLLKGWLTSIFPAFHFRNFTSNQFNLMLKVGVDALNPTYRQQSFHVMSSILSGKKPVGSIKFADGRVIKLEDLIKDIQKHSDFLDRGAFDDIEFLLENVAKEYSKNPLSPRFFVLEKTKQWGTAIEMESKLIGVMSLMNQGLDIKDAIKGAEEALFNYRALTTFEKDIMRRLIPFYTWARKNFEFQLRTLATTPGRTAAQIKFVRGIGESFGEPMADSDREGLPSWAVDSLGIKVSNKAVGGTSYMTGLGLPIEEFLKRFSGENGFVWNSVKNTMAQMNPLVKFPIERATGVDLFRGKPITEIDNGANLKPFLEVLPKPVEKQLKDLLQYREVTVPRYLNGKKIGEETKYVANPFALHWLRNLPTSRITSTIGGSQTGDITKFENALKLATGISSFDIDKDRQQFFNDLNEKKELVDFLTRIGVLKTKEINYQPK